jgi:hypothetical protein
MDDDIEQAWLAEIKRRKDEIKSGKVTPVPGEDVHKAARKLLLLNILNENRNIGAPKKITHYE